MPPSAWTFDQIDPCLQKGDFQSIFDRSASAVTPSKKFKPHYYALSNFSKTVCHEVSLCENFQRQGYKAFTGLSNRAQMVGWGRSLQPEIFGPNDLPLARKPSHKGGSETQNDRFSYQNLNNSLR